ncbi:MAG: type I-MYXAN CRISPR-associated endonuclease Cas1 [Blastocatellia bacterium]|nr:type I-MYXAN CRISPR-associated endonuclease Cas1 [Blastocatellia bacterium]
MSSNLPIHGLHALAYCERLFYLENVEQLRVADARVYAGRRLHVEIEKKEDDGEVLQLTLESERWGLIGKVDCIRRRDGMLIPYEHKRGRAARDMDGKQAAWWSDKLQVFAYAALIEEHSGQTVTEGRIRYHADNVMVRVTIDDDAWRLLAESIGRARELQASTVRPPVAANERLCAKCSLAPVCLPEEARLGMVVKTERSLDASESDAPMAISLGGAPNRRAESVLSGPDSKRKAVRLFPADDDRQALHVLTQGARVGRKGDRIEVASPVKEELPMLYPVHEIGQVVLHGFAQISTQALGFCAQNEIGVHWVTNGGRYLGAWSSGAGSVQRRIRQYKALSDPEFCLQLARQLVESRVRGQLSHLLRASRDSVAKSGEGTEAARQEFLMNCITTIRKLLGPMSRAGSIHSLRGYEGSIGAQYFKALPRLISPEAGAAMIPDGRSRRPPRDRCNALLSFGYSLLQRDILNAILVVGLDPSLGFYHQPRSQAHPLALDLMELFRVPLVDLPVIASINRRQWDEDEDFQIAGKQVWLSDAGRRKLIAIYERRKSDQWKHPVIGYSLSYSRLIELEARLLEKEWMNEGGLFARFRLR